MGIYAKAYYTVHILGLNENLNLALFKAIQDEKLALDSNESMISFFTEHGVDNSIATSAFEHSTTIDMRVNESMIIMARFHINGIPSFIVNQQYKTDLQMAKNATRMLKIMDFLVKESSKLKQ